jgi:hypothetical protein
VALCAGASGTGKAWEGMFLGPWVEDRCERVTGVFSVCQAPKDIADLLPPPLVSF